VVLEEQRENSGELSGIDGKPDDFMKSSLKTGHVHKADGIKNVRHTSSSDVSGSTSDHV